MKITVQFESLEEFQKFIGAAGEVAEEKKEKKQLTKEELNESAKKTADIINAAEAKEEAEKAEKKKKKAEVPFDEDKKEEPKDYAALRVECRKVLAELNKATGKNTASELIKKRGAEKLTGVRDTDLEGLMAEAREALKDAE